MMVSTLDENPTQPLNPTTTTTFRWPPIRRKTSLRRRKLPSIRLGGRRRKPIRSLVKIFKKLRVKWMQLRYMFVLKRLKQVYVKMIGEIIDAGSAAESFLQKMTMESSFALPVMGISFSNYPSSTGLNPSRGASSYVL